MATLTYSITIKVKIKRNKRKREYKKFKNLSKKWDARKDVNMICTNMKYIYIIPKRHETHLSGRNPRKAKLYFILLYQLVLRRASSTSTTASTLSLYNLGSSYQCVLSVCPMCVTHYLTYRHNVKTIIQGVFEIWV